MSLRSAHLHVSLPSNVRSMLNNDSSRRTSMDTKVVVKKSSSAKKRPSAISSAMQVSLVPLERQRNGASSEGILGVPILVADVAAAVARLLQGKVMERRRWASQVQLFIERAIMNCRFFTLAAVAGSLIGSIICFFEGCFLILEAFFQYFHTMSHHLDQGGIMNLIMEATGMFLTGSGMLNFGMAMYIIFVGTNGVKSCGNRTISGLSRASALLHQTVIRSSMGAKWISHAKTRLGHGVLMMLQAGTVEKFKSVPVASALDLVCLAGALMLAAASVFVLSKLHNGGSSHADRHEQHNGSSLPGSGPS